MGGGIGLSASAAVWGPFFGGGRAGKHRVGSRGTLAIEALLPPAPPEATLRAIVDECCRCAELSGAPLARLCLLARCAREVDFAAGAPLGPVEGEPPVDVFLVLEGTVLLSKAVKAKRRTGSPGRAGRGHAGSPTGEGGWRRAAAALSAGASARFFQAEPADATVAALGAHALVGADAMANTPHRYRCSANAQTYVRCLAFPVAMFVSALDLDTVEGIRNNPLQLPSSHDVTECLASRRRLGAAKAELAREVLGDAFRERARGGRAPRQRRRPAPSMAHSLPVAAASRQRVADRCESSEAGAMSDAPQGIETINPFLDALQSFDRRGEGASLARHLRQALYGDESDSNDELSLSPSPNTSPGRSRPGSPMHGGSRPPSRCTGAGSAGGRPPSRVGDEIGSPRCDSPSRSSLQRSPRRAATVTVEMLRPTSPVSRSSLATLVSPTLLQNAREGIAPHEQIDLRVSASLRAYNFSASATAFASGAAGRQVLVPAAQLMLLKVAYLSGSGRTESAVLHPERTDVLHAAWESAVLKYGARFTRWTADEVVVALDSNPKVRRSTKFLMNTCSAFFRVTYSNFHHSHTHSRYFRVKLLISLCWHVLTISPKDPDQAVRLMLTLRDVTRKLAMASGRAPACDGDSEPHARCVLYCSLAIGALHVATMSKAGGRRFITSLTGEAYEQASALLAEAQSTSGSSTREVLLCSAPVCDAVAHLYELRGRHNSGGRELLGSKVGDYELTAESLGLQALREVTLAELKATAVGVRAKGLGTASRPFSARPARPSTARPSTARPSTARPSTARPSTARPSTALPSTARPSIARARPATTRQAMTATTRQAMTARPMTARQRTGTAATAPVTMSRSLGAERVERHRLRPRSAVPRAQTPSTPTPEVMPQRPHTSHGQRRDAPTLATSRQASGRATSRSTSVAPTLAAAAAQAQGASSRMAHHHHWGGWGSARSIRARP